MSVELVILLGFVFHLMGDYLFQTHKMAIDKTERYDTALLHATIYSFCFLLLVKFSWAWFFIWSTHFFIDRFRLAKYWIMFINNTWDTNGDNNGYPLGVPVWLTTWLMIAVDNILHISINTLCIYLHYSAT